MEAFSAQSFIVWIAILSAVIVVSALLSGLVERTGFPHIAVFLGLGAALGPHGLGLLEVGLDSSILRVVATLSLTLVLFTDAVSLNVREVRRHYGLVIRLLGPGTLFSAALMALAARAWIGVSIPMALVLGASLASTDPVLLRNLMRRTDVPAGARQALRLESGLNDVVLLPIVVVALSFASHDAERLPSEWTRMALDLFVLGPGAGVLVGLAGVIALDRMRRSLGVKRDYESLYSLGVAFAAYAAAESVHGSGFLAAFAAGLTIAALDVELCDCFLEYGEVTAEMLLMLTFVLFGASLIWTGLTSLGPVTLLFAAFAILVRPPVYLLSLAGSGVDRISARIIAWFGGRGLSSLLLVLLAVFEGAPESGTIFRVCCTVVLLSVVVHGSSSVAWSWFSQRREEDAKAPTSLPEPVPSQSLVAPGGVAALASHAKPGTQVELHIDSDDLPAVNAQPDSRRRAGPIQPASHQYITLDELRGLWESGAPVVLADVRTERTYESSPLQAKGAVRLDPGGAVRAAKSLRLPPQAWIALYCA